MNQYVCLLLLSACVGIMLFFTVIVAPSIFKVLPAEEAAKYVRAFFPKYYLSLGVMSLVATFLASDLPTLQTLFVCSLLLFFSYAWVTPQINQAKDQGKLTRFKVLHACSVALNSIVMGLFIALLVMNFKQD